MILVDYSNYLFNIVDNNIKLEET